MRQKLITIIIILLLPFISKAQKPVLDKGLELFEKQDYVSALKILKKIRPQTTDLLEKIAYSHTALEEYDSALVYFEKYIQRTSSTSSDAQIKYISALKRSGDYTLVIRKLEELKNKKNNPYLNKELEFLNFLIRDTLSKKYRIQNEGFINTTTDEMSPLVTDKKVVFTSNRMNDAIRFEKNENSKSYTYKIFSSSLASDSSTFSFKNDSEESQNIVINRGELKINNSKKLRISPKANILPFSVNDFSDNGNFSICEKTQKAYFTRIDKFDSENRNRSKLAKPQIYEINYPTEDEVAKKIDFNNSYNIYQHPAISPDGTLLVFASDISGGLGKLDLYYSINISGKWSNPKNLGPQINTAGNDCYPSFRSDGVLFFSSDGLPGFGGLDIFYTNDCKRASFSNPINAGWQINSPLDDHGISYSKDLNSGVLSSNRKGGSGGYDLYSFTSLYPFKKIEGVLHEEENVNATLKFQKIYLKDKEGNVILISETDSGGYFVFYGLNSDKSYLIELAYDDLASLKNKKLVFVDTKNNVISKAVINKEGKMFFYTELNSDLTVLTKEAERDKGSLFYRGYIYKIDDKGNQIAVNGKTILLINSKGDTIQRIKSRLFGSYVFSSLLSDQSYFIVIPEEDDAQINYFVTDNKGVEIINTKTGERRKLFTIASDEVSLAKSEETDVKFMRKIISGFAFGLDNNEVALSEQEVYLKSANGVLVYKSKTDKRGYFEFSELPIDSSFIIYFDPNDPALKQYQKLIIKNNQLKASGLLYRLHNEGLELKLLHGDNSTLTEYYYHDPWVELSKQIKESRQNSKEVKSVIIENIYYDVNSAELNNEAKTILNKVYQVLGTSNDLKIEIGSHTDSRAEANYNLELSLKRAETAVNYLVQLGVEKSKLIAKGYGESKLLNHCNDNANCSEEEHKQNRRTEFHVFQKN